MGIFPASPAIEVFAPPAMTPGGTYPVTIELTPKEQVAVEWVDVTLTHRVGWAVGSGKSRRAYEVVPFALEARVFEGPSLPRGRSRFVVNFALPADAAPSYEGDIAYARWELAVRASIPWWPDARGRFVLAVAGPSSSSTAPTPRIYKSTQDGDPANAPRLELSLASDVVSLGGIVSGSLALFHLEPGKRYQTEVALTENLALVSRNGREDVVRGNAHAVEGIVESDAASTPFRFKLPDITPTFSCPAFRLAYTLVVRVDKGLWRKLSLAVPVTVVRDTELAKGSFAHSVPLVGASRLDEACRDAAARRGWTYEGGVMRRTLETAEGTTSADAYREDRARTGSMLVLKMSYPSLAIGLEVTPCSRLGGFFSSDVNLGTLDFDARHTVRARDAAQALAALAPVVAELPREPTVRVDDDDLCFEQPDAELSTPAIEAFLARAERLMAALATGRAAIRPPGDMDARTDELVALAAERNARLRLADLTLELWLGHAPARIALGFDGRGVPECHRIEVTPAPPPPDGTSIQLATRDEAAGRSELSPEARALLARLPAGTRDIAIDTTAMRAELPLAPGPPPTARHREALSIADALASLAPLLSPHHGPFR